jgi:hypothetical protein
MNTSNMIVFAPNPPVRAFMGQGVRDTLWTACAMGFAALMLGHLPMNGNHPAQGLDVSAVEFTALRDANMAAVAARHDDSRYSIVRAAEEMGTPLTLPSSQDYVTLLDQVGIDFLRERAINAKVLSDEVKDRIRSGTGTALDRKILDYETTRLDFYRALIDMRMPL